MWNYNKEVMDHFLNPRNVGEIENADGVGEVGNISCGDALRFTFKLGEDGRIAEAKFKTFGCASAIASSSALTELVIGMTLEEAAKITNNDIVKVLGDLPEEKMHCSVMGMEALEAAIANYNGEEVDNGDDDHEGVIICKCFGITDNTIRKVAKLNKLHDAHEITNYSKAGGACGACLNKIQDILDDMWQEAQVEVNNFDSLSMVQKIVKIQEVIDREIKPILQNDGGNIEFIDLQGDIVKVQLQGSCLGCPSSAMTLKGLVEEKIQECVSPKLQVENV